MGSGRDRQWEEKQNIIQRLECVQSIETTEQNTVGGWWIQLEHNMTGVNGKSKAEKIHRNQTMKGFVKQVKEFRLYLRMLAVQKGSYQRKESLQ